MYRTKTVTKLRGTYYENLNSKSVLYRPFQSRIKSYKHQRDGKIPRYFAHRSGKIEIEFLDVSFLRAVSPVYFARP